MNQYTYFLVNLFKKLRKAFKVTPCASAGASLARGPIPGL